MTAAKTVVILGGGPAGMSCALWLKHYNFNPVLIERREALGGLQRLNASRNKWLLGHPSITGLEMSETFQRSLALEDIPVFLNTEVTGVEKESYGFRVTLRSPAGQSLLKAVAIVIATGTRLKEAEAFAGVPGIEEVVGQNLISFIPPGTNNLMYFAGKRVAVIGGGDNALETVFSLERVAAHVDLIVRSHLRAQGWMQDKLHYSIRARRVTLHAPAKLRRFQASGDGVQLRLESRQVLSVHHVIARTGFTPANALLDTLFPTLARDEQGYLVTEGHSMETNTPGVYAVGDVCNPVNPCVATAIAHGTVAARSIEQRYRSAFAPVNIEQWEHLQKAV